MKLRLYTAILLSFFSLTKAYAQLASTPCAAGPLPNACAPNTINLTSAFTNSGVTNPSTANGVGCSSVGSDITAGQIGGPGNSQAYDAWYTTVVDANGDVTVYAAIVTGDPVVGIYSGSNCSTLTLRSCDDDSGTGLDAYATASGLTPGSTVWIRVWDYNGGTGTYTTTSTGGTPPANDNCASPQNLTVNAAPVPGTDYCATIETSDWQDCEGNTEGNVWYSFTIPTSGQTTVNITNISCFGSGNGVDVTIMTGNCAAFSSVICQQAISSNSAINFTGIGGTTYYIMVDGDNAGGANSLCDFDIDVDVAAPFCGTVDYHAEINTSPYTQINPFPLTMSCLDPWIYLAANDTVVSGNYISPSFNFIVTGNVDNNDQIWIYQGGTATLGSGTAIFANSIPNSTTYTVYGDLLSATTPYYLELCNTSGNIPWQVENAGTGTIQGSGTSNSGNGNCQRFGPFFPEGIATWTSNAPAGSINLTTTSGLTYFDPAIAGPGSYQITYNWDDENGCTGSSTKTITVTAPYSFTSLDYATVCINSGNISPTLVADAGGVYSSPTLGASLNTTTGVVNSNTAPAGTHTITYTLGTMPCGVEGIATITINPLMTASAASSSPTVCINNAITNITHTTTGATSIGAATGLPAGVSAGFAGNTITISGTPTASGTFNYSIPLIGGCGTVNATGTITVNPNNTVTPASSSPTVCINTAITNISHTTTGATGIGAATGLPSGVSAGFTGNTITISGTPTANGTFNYSIPLTGGCGTVNATGTITVTPNNTVTPASSSPTVCINTAITNITHTTTGATSIGAATGLPVGVSANWSGNTITISGTPTASGTFNYSIPLTGGCGTVNATGTITVTPLDIASFSYSGNTYCLTGTNPTPISVSLPGGVFTISGIGVINASTGQINLAASGLGTFTVTYNTAVLGNPCPNTATTNITITAAPSAAFSYDAATYCQNASAPVITFGAGASAGVFSSTPAGLTLNTSNGAITLSTSTAGVYTVYNSIAASGGCAAAIDSTTITINPNATINLTSAGSTTNQTLCINTPITNITYGIGGGGTGAGVTGLPSGVTGSFGAGVFTISGTPTASGTFNYTVTTTGTCGQVSSAGTITITPNNTVTPASSSPTVCINTAITNITHTTTGATGIGAATGLPAGVSAGFSGNTITISGTPTASGTFNYSIPLTAGCGAVNATGTITVTPNNTVTPASSSPTVCINTAITNITHTTTGATGIGAATGLPAGVSANWSGNTITIIGTPTASGTFNYSIPLTGGCGIVNATGTITVTPDNIVSSASSSPTVCINTAITNITHTTTGATGIGAATGLPAGVSAGFAGNTITISGTPTASGTFNYSIPLTGGCGTVNATGTITVTPNNTVTPASSSPTVCINNVMTNITHTTTGATGIGAATGLPAGVSAGFAGNTITISGIPTASGTFNYSIPLTGGCGTVNATGTITVNPDMTVTPASSSPTVCINTAITNITHTTTGATGIGAATGLPAGVSANWAGNTITISGTPTASGTFNYSIPLTGGCGTVNATGTITVNPNMTVTPASSSPTVCINTAITNITHTTTGATGIGAATGLPAGVSAGFAGNTITISGTPTASGTFNYSIPLTGGCGTVSATGTITVTPNNTVTPASSSPTVCINTAITNITHTTTGATGIGAATGLPAGVSANWSGNTITISGIPTASGTFNYSIPLTGGCGTVNATGTITVNPDPTINITTASECENIPGSGEALNIDVTALGTAINATANITWYTDNTYTTPYNPTNETVSNGEVFYFEVELNGCIVQGTITYSVSGNIVLNDPAPEFCEDVLGGGSVANVDLTTFNNSVFAGASSYTWATGPTGVTINNGDSINVQVQQGSCPTVDIFVHFTVNPLPTATISGSDTICAGDAIPDVTITLTGTGPWSVTYTNGTTPVTINPATSPATLSGLADGTYTITAVSDNNCTGTFSGSATILTNPLPTATISGGGTICAGDAIPDATITLTGTGPWSVTYTDGTIPVTINPATSPVTLSGLADGTYTVTAVSDNNCTGTFSGSATILTNPLPTAIDQNPQVCEDASTPGSAAGVDLTTLNSSIDGGAGNTLTWYTDAGLTLPVGTPTNTTVNDNDVFYVLVDNGTCSDTAVVTYDVTSTITLNAQTPSLCEDAVGSGTVANVDLTSYNNAIYSGGATFDWYQDAGLTTPVVTPTAVTVTNGLTLYVDVTDGNCNNNSSITFTINPIFFVQESTNICSGASYTFPDGTTQTNITAQVIYNSNLTTTLGCDSIIETTVNVNPTYNIQETVAVCSGGSYTFPDGTTQTNITTQVIYNSNLTTTLGCDSIIETTVDVNPVIFVQETVNVCSGGSYTFPDGTTQTNITTQVVYNSNLTTSLGCDSIIETTVDVNPVIFIQETVNVCSGGSYTFPDGTTQTNITTQVIYNSNLTTTLGCDSIIETTVNVDPQLSIVAGSVTPICFGENITLTATGSGNGTVTWYSDAAGTNVIGTGSPFNATSQVSTTGSYTFYVNEAGTCSSTLTAVNVTVGGVTAAITATPTSGFMPLDVAFGNNSSTGPTVNYAWVFGDGTANSIQFEPTHTYTNLGNYTATLIVTDGVCFDTATVVIEVIGQSTILIPNVFTPNGDGSNDVFTVDGTNLESVEGQIFNRWGQKMFGWNGVRGYWDGRTQSGSEAPDGTYFYIIKAKGMDDVEYFKKGGFSLIR